MADTYKVIQADRDAAADIVRWQRSATAEWKAQDGEGVWQFFVEGFSRAIRQGIWDEHPVVQSFAKHREDTEVLVVGWRPIETAPKDFTPILAHAIGADGRPMIAIVRWADTETMFSSSIPRMNFGAATCAWVGEMGARYGVPFTHWMPLPSPPGDHHTNNTPGD